MADGRRAPEHSSRRPLNSNVGQPMRITCMVGICVLALALSHQTHAGKNPVPAPEEIVSCSVVSTPRPGDGAWKPPDANCATLSAFLNGAKVVTKEEWLNNYSHVAFADSEGILRLRSGDAIRWMLRPGGLGRLTFPDGSELHLVKCCGK